MTTTGITIRIETPNGPRDSGHYIEIHGDPRDYQGARFVGFEIAEQIVGIIDAASAAHKAAKKLARKGRHAKP